MTGNAIPAYVSEADFTVVGSIGDVLALDRDTIRRAVRKVDPACLRALVRGEPSAGFELLIGDDVTSLWFAGRRLAVMSTRAKP